jgi:hypothetical protein
MEPYFHYPGTSSWRDSWLIEHKNSFTFHLIFYYDNIINIHCCLSLNSDFKNEMMCHHISFLLFTALALHVNHFVPSNKTVHLNFWETRFEVSLNFNVNVA